jgi:hypothetical protein
VTQKDVKAKVVARDQVVTVVKGDGTTAEHAIKGLPPEFITWQMEARQALFQHLGREPSIPTFAPHLPTLVTWGEGALFPNLAAKGMGLLPRAELLEEYAAEFENLLARLAGRPWPETIQERVAAAQRFYGRVEAVDRRCLGGLEIFEGTTYRNLLSNPFASLLYVGPGPRYRSFQLDCVVEVVSPGDSRYRFIRSIRGLFEHERFHYQQPDYPFGYVFWVVEARDKSLKVRRKS